MKIDKVLAVVLIVLTLAVSMPLSIKTYQQSGGPWGFGIVGLYILLPLNTYVLFAFSALLNNEKFRWRIFVAAHLVSLTVGLICFLLFPIALEVILPIPALLALVSFFYRKRLPMFLCVMLTLGVAANALLLKWELDFGRPVPIIEVFRSTTTLEP